MQTERGEDSSQKLAEAVLSCACSITLLLPDFQVSGSYLHSPGLQARVHMSRQCNPRLTDIAATLICWSSSDHC